MEARNKDLHWGHDTKTSPGGTRHTDRLTRRLSVRLPAQDGFTAVGDAGLRENSCFALAEHGTAKTPAEAPTEAPGETERALPTRH